MHKAAGAPTLRYHHAELVLPLAHAKSVMVSLEFVGCEFIYAPQQTLYCQAVNFQLTASPMADA